jgi:hypothetical protein
MFRLQANIIMNNYDSPVLSNPSPHDRPFPNFSTSVLANQHYHALYGLLLCCRWYPAAHTETYFTGAPHLHWNWAVRVLLDSFLLCSNVQFPDTLSIGPCAGSQDTPARTASDSFNMYHNMCAIIQSTALWRSGGHIWNCGRRVQ